MRAREAPRTSRGKNPPTLTCRVVAPAQRSVSVSIEKGRRFGKLPAAHVRTLHNTIVSQRGSERASERRVAWNDSALSQAAERAVVTSRRTSQRRRASRRHTRAIVKPRPEGFPDAACGVDHLVAAGQTEKEKERQNLSQKEGRKNERMKRKNEQKERKRERKNRVRGSPGIISRASPFLQPFLHGLVKDNWLGELLRGVGCRRLGNRCVWRFLEARRKRRRRATPRNDPDTYDKGCAAMRLCYLLRKP